MAGTSLWSKTREGRTHREEGPIRCQDDYYGSALYVDPLRGAVAEFAQPAQLSSQGTNERIVVHIWSSHRMMSALGPHKCEYCATGILELEVDAFDYSYHQNIERFANFRRIGSSGVSLSEVTTVHLVPRLTQLDDPLTATTLNAEFKTLVEQWCAETGMLSSTSKKTSHPAYQQIIAIGEKAVPLILEELKERPSHWFVALRSITGENPAPPEAAGYVEQLADAWIKWGQEKGYIS